MGQMKKKKTPTTMQIKDAASLCVRACDRQELENSHIMKKAQDRTSNCFYNSHHMADQARYGSLRLKPATNAG